MPHTSLAQTSCTSDVRARNPAECAELDKLLQEEAHWTAELNKAKASSASFQSDINALEAKIKAAQANINGKNITIRNLSKDITVKETQIVALNTRAERIRRSIADVLKKTNDVSSYSVVEAVLSDKGLSDFFVDIDTYASTEKSLSILLAELRGTKELTEQEKLALSKKREAESAEKAKIEAAKKGVEIDQDEKARLLAISKNQEKTYAQEVAARQAKAAQIRAVLFPLRDAGAIPFGTALQYAQTASQKTGVQASLILAILQQESNLGANVGSCVIADLSTGATKGVNTGRLFSNGIHPTRDLPLLQTILNGLGRDPLTTRVSCPIAGVAGYGGAMGPAQFIPSTWNIMQSKVASALGKTTPDPWNPQDAIMAMALFLKDIMGTSGDPYIDQRTAACRYYSGRTCYGSSGPNAGLSYGNSVMSKATTIQRDIDFLQGV